jgi:lysophospholipase L1-like esterase
MKKKGAIARWAGRIFQAIVIVFITWILLEGGSFLAIFILSKYQNPVQSLDDTLNYREFVQNFHPLFRRWSENLPAFLRRDSTSIFYVSTRTGFRFRANSAYSGKLVTNAEGFICNDTCEPLPYQKPPGEYRIFIIGGSSAAGHGVENGSETIAAHLERLIAASTLFPGRHVRVVNAGIGGHFSGQEVVTLAYRVMSFHPDMFLIYDGYNDFLQFMWLHFDPAAITYRNLLERNLSYYDYELMYGFNKVQTVSGSFSQFFDILNNQYPVLYYTLHLAKIVSFWMQTSGGKQPAAVTGSQPGEQQIKNWISSPEQNSALTYLANVDTMAAIARGQGIPAVLCLQPTLPFTPGGHPIKDTLVGPERAGVEAPWNHAREYNQYFDYALAQFRERIAANSGSVHYCDMTGMFQKVADQIFIDAVHLTSKGNELVAKRFLAEIEQVVHPP